ncbi:MAG: hypothetical protein OMM_07110 [Candidatus Magnetoglobus multicellularis str. Araruama]|uniref:Uncharacterized protein n=1 Tax=Candidatus Magnetoglobus multicellularis str. Araruama TaxID=890399 RepID=A0A1V1PEH5_9BACT|nr:MAG: hypothetical protein OMM_07110 [Candidatus Magnetoglobus multicellularis str. Araruama]
MFLDNLSNGLKKKGCVIMARSGLLGISKLGFRPTRIPENNLGSKSIFSKPSRILEDKLESSYDSHDLKYTFSIINVSFGVFIIIVQ